MVSFSELRVHNVPYTGNGVNPLSFRAEPKAVKGGRKWFNPGCVQHLSDFQPIYPTLPEDVDYLYKAIGLVDTFFYSIYDRHPHRYSAQGDFTPLANAYWGDRPPTVVSIGTGFGVIDMNIAQALTMCNNPSDIHIISTNLTPSGHLPLQRINPKISRKLEKWSGSGIDIVEEMNRQSMQFDIVIATRSMSGISGIPYKEFLSGCAKILRKGGLLMSDVFTPNMRNLLQIVYPGREHGDNTYYDERSLEIDLQQCGYTKPVYDHYCHVPGMVRYTMNDPEIQQQLTQKLRDNNLLEKPTHIMYLAVKK